MKIKNLGIICAKKHSSGLKRKNLKKINGKSLFEITCGHFKKSKLVEKVIVSTDSDEISKIAKKYDFDVPFKRPKYLSRKLSPEWNVWKHVLDFFHKKYKYYPERVIILPCTSPKRDPDIIDRSIRKFQRMNSDVLISICKTNLNPLFNMVKIKKNKKINIFQKTKKKIYNRQEATQVFKIATNIYILKSYHILKKNHIFETSKIDYIEIEKKRAIDIDDELDFKIAKNI